MFSHGRTIAEAIKKKISSETFLTHLFVIIRD